MKKVLISLVAAPAILCGCTGANPTLSQTHAANVDKGTTDDAVVIKKPLADSAVLRSTADVAAIRKLFADNAAALSAGNLAALAQLYEQDAIQLPPNSPAVIGWEAIRSRLASELEGIKVAATIEVIEVCPSDNWAFARGSYRMVTTPQQGGGDPQVTMGNWLDILRRQPDNSWKIARSTWSSEE